jgi:hypothetical protein
LCNEDGSGGETPGDTSPGDYTSPGNDNPYGGTGNGTGNTGSPTNENPDNNENEPVDNLGEDLTLPVVKPKKTTPCEELKKVSNSPNYNESINFLKQKATGPKEHAWVYKYFQNSTNFAPPTVAGHNTENPNTVNLDAYKDNIWIGAFHNHTQGNNPTVKMFSPKDMEWLLRKALKKIVTNRQVHHHKE